ncbi:hypothetical protein Bbelb_383050 [Branchiostoma belcheri]|nr:hypothetical protein Bbelb_383050 [Branchiostoma belcheri]
MAAKTALPTEEEIDKMKPLKLAKLFQELGLTEEETEEMETIELRTELKKRIRDIQAAAATRRRPGQITEMLQRAMTENRRKREGLTAICDLILDFAEKMEDDDKQKMTDVFGKDFRVVLEDVRTFLKNDDCPILVIGETSSGKSSLLNLLLGQDILPVSHLACTSTLCFVRHGKMGREDAEEVEKVVIQWPLESLKGGICLVDGPGILATRKMDEVVAGAVSSTCAFIYMINSAIPLKPAPSLRGNGEGTDEHMDGLSRLLKWCQKHKWGDVFHMFDLESTIFVCNKWDSVQREETEVVKEDYLKTLRGHFPELRDDQVFFLSCNKAVGPAGLLSADFTRLLDRLDVLLPQSLQHKLELQHQHVWLVLQKASQYIRLKLHSAYGTQAERRKAREVVQWRLARFETHAKEVLRNLEKMLTATRREAEGHLRTFLNNEALKNSVYQKVLNDFPEVDTSVIGTARLITAIANEMESQLKSNPNSAFNRCIREADIKLKEQFETEFGAVLKQHNDVIEEMLSSPPLPDPFQKVYMIFQETFFTIVSVFSKAYALARAIDPTLGSQIWAMVDLAQSLQNILVSPEDRVEYIKHLTNKVFGSATKADAIRSAVAKHLKGPIDYLQACKDAIPRLKQVDEKILQDAETETRSEEEIRRKYEPKLDTISNLTEELCSFYATNIMKHEFDLTLGKPGESNWHPLEVGGQGRIYLVEVSKDGGKFTVAVKIPRQLPSGHLMNFVIEAENLRKLKGCHIVKCYGTYQGETDANGTQCLGLVMEYCPKTLDTEMFEKGENSPAWWGSDPEKQAAAFSYTQNLAVQLCEGLKHIHDAGYIHRDLKLINVLVSPEGVVKLADLGSSKSEKAYARTKEGTLFYTAPEVLAQKKYNRSADMYSMGVILLEMWYGRTIYYPEDPMYESQFNKAVPLNVGQELPLPSWPGRAPPIPEWRNLINDCLRKNTEKRPTAEKCWDRIAGMSLPPTRADAGNCFQWKPDPGRELRAWQISGTAARLPAPHPRRYNGSKVIKRPRGRPRRRWEDPPFDFLRRVGVTKDSWRVLAADRSLWPETAVYGRHAFTLKPADD